MPEADDLIVALAPVVAALNRVQVRYYVSGSIASSFHGATRATMDVDLVCELSDRQVPDFLAALGPDYYRSEQAIRDAIETKRCFNLIHLPTSFKVDLFISEGRPFDAEAMARAPLGRLSETSPLEVPIASVEDAIVSKLHWYRLAGETSQRQWDDVSRLVDLHGDALDRPYLRRAAQSLDVADLLDRLLQGP